MHLDGMDVRYTYIQNETQKKHAVKKEPYHYDELRTVISHMVTTCTGLGVIAAGYVLNEPLAVGAGLALFLKGSEDWQFYDKYGRPQRPIESQKK
jgi:hypothetical protein